MIVKKRVAAAVLLVLGACGGTEETTPTQAPAREQAPTSVTMSAAEIRSAGVVSEPAAMGEIIAHEELPGSIEAPRDALVVVNTRVAGVVESLSVDVGDRVRARQRLAIVRSVELAEAQADYRANVVGQEFADSALARSEDLLREGVVSQRRVEADRLAVNERRFAREEAAARVRILGGATSDASGTMTIVSPIAGVVSARNVNTGEAVESNGALFTVVDVSKVVVQLRAPARVHAEPGTAITFTVEGLSGRTFNAVVRSSSDVIDPETRRFFIRCAVENPEGLLKPGMFITGRVPRATPSVITVPESAVQVMNGVSVVFVAQVGGRFDRRVVALGARADGRVAVTSGVAVGERVVVQGSFWVRTQLQRSELEE